MSGENSISDGLRNRRPTTSKNNDSAASQLQTTPKASNASPAASAATAATTTAASSATTIVRSDNNTNSGKLIVVLLHIAAIACFVYGIVLRTSQLHTGEECSMTYSMRVFVEIETETTTPRLQNTPATSKYRLYKFVDKRDPRYQTMLRKRRYKKAHHNPPLKRNAHCLQEPDQSHNSNIVVYVPGHWGSYDQARSLGAHGISLTRAEESSSLIREAHKRLLASAQDDGTGGGTIEDFVYDVYALDFAEQGGGLHGQFLNYQSDYLATILHQLSEDCELSLSSSSSSSDGSRSITLVAHSMGGYVARRVLLDNPSLPVKNLITLATPHSNPLYSFDRSVSNFHRELHQPAASTTTTTTTTDKEPPLIVSISGGLRDEMIEPSACDTTAPASIGSEGDCQAGEEALNFLTILGTKLVETANSKANSKANKSAESSSILLGMDHRAIVWCHELLEEVRLVLWTLVASSGDNAQERLDKVRKAVGGSSDSDSDSDCNYAKDLIELNQSLATKFGVWQAIGMESSMIYNLPYLLALYALLVALRCARTTTDDRGWKASMLPVWAVVLFGWTLRRDIGWLATIILALVANAVHHVLVYPMPVGFILRRRRSSKNDSGPSIDETKKDNTKENDAAEKKPKPPLRVLWKVLVQALTAVYGVIFVEVFTMVFPKLFGHHVFVVNDWPGFLESALFVYTSISIYVMLIVWMLFLDDKNNNNKGGAGFEIQLIVLVMMVVPFLVTGPLVLMIWEQKMQPSSWWTLLSLHVPVTILVLIKLSRTKTTIGSESTAAEAATPLPGKQRRRIATKARSIAVYGTVFFLCCYREQGLLSKGTGYLVPTLASAMVWIEVAFSLLAGQS